MEALQIRNEYTPDAILKNGKAESSARGRYVSEEEYWEKYYEHPDFNYEWNNGYLEEKPVTDLDGSLMYQWFFKVLQNFLEINPVAIMMNLEMGFRLAMLSKTTIRKPDLGVIADNNIIQPEGKDCTFKGVFDICVESLSHADRDAVTRDTIIKKREYENIGVKEYYILDAWKEKTVFYKRNKRGNYTKIKPVGKDIIRSAALPGFQFRISDLYKQPSLLSLTEDKVYQKFIMTHYQRERKLKNRECKLKNRERKLKEEALKQVDQERKLRDMATERAERVEAKLRELGIVI